MHIGIAVFDVFNDRLHCEWESVWTYRSYSVPKRFWFILYLMTPISCGHLLSSAFAVQIFLVPNEEQRLPADNICSVACTAIQPQKLINKNKEYKCCPKTTTRHFASIYVSAMASATTTTTTMTATMTIICHFDYLIISHFVVLFCGKMDWKLSLTENTIQYKTHYPFGTPNSSFHCHSVCASAPEFLPFIDRCWDSDTRWDRSDTEKHIDRFCHHNCLMKLCACVLV